MNDLMSCQVMDCNKMTTKLVAKLCQKINKS